MYLLLFQSSKQLSEFSYTDAYMYEHMEYKVLQLNGEQANGRLTINDGNFGTCGYHDRWHSLSSIHKYSRVTARRERRRDRLCKRHRPRVYTQLRLFRYERNVKRPEPFN